MGKETYISLQKTLKKTYRKLIKMVESALRKQLKDVQLKAVLKSKHFKPLVSECLSDIKTQATKAKNEATVESAFEITFYGLLKEIGIKLYPEKQKLIETRRHINKGRADSSYGAVVIEFKHHYKLSTEKQIDDATKQINDYLLGLSKKGEHYLGLITDGIKGKFIKCQNKELTEGAIHELKEEDIIWLIKNILSLKTKDLNSKNLIAEFCSPDQGDLAKRLTIYLYGALKKSPSDKTNMLNSEWERLFKLGHEDISHQQKIENRGEVLSELVGAKSLSFPEQYDVLFCLQTTYAIIVKLIAYRVVSDIVVKSPPQNFKSLSSADYETLRIFFGEFEDGSLIRTLGIDNLLEGDFFSWYCSEDQWNEEIYQILKEIIFRLSDYEEKSDIFDKTNVNDLFRDLYQQIIPGVVRYSLGEYYTPKWLAQHLLMNATNGKDIWRGLDPTAGSGTFLVAMIEKIIADNGSIPKDKIFEQITNRVKGIDLNPLAVLTARVNYFIAISPYIPDDFTYIEIPVYLGDSANIPKEQEIDGVDCICYTINTELGELEITIPKSALDSPKHFSKAMYQTEDSIERSDEDEAFQALISIIPEEERTPAVQKNTRKLIKTLIELEERNWNRIWSRIIKNFISTACLGKFDVIIGNPPWIDWKNLPTGYRETIKSLCISRNLFSGDGLTGGINLNICALITNVVAENWLSDEGIFGFLMPKPILFQQTYDGFRKLKLENRPQMYFKELHDWTKAGSPFYPVQQEFLTYYFGFHELTDNKIPVKKFIAKPRAGIKDKQTCEWSEVKDLFEVEEFFAQQLSADHSTFTYVTPSDSGITVGTTHDIFKKISGRCEYKGREGVEFYPETITIFELDGSKPNPGKGRVWLKNIKNQKAKYKVPPFSTLMEKKYLFPLVKGRNVKQFQVDYSGLVVPFPYERITHRKAIPPHKLKKSSPLLLKHFNKYKSIIESQTQYNKKIKGKYGDVFYSYARVGKYTFSPVHVVYRDNTKWCAAVVGQLKAPWGNHKRALFQNHAPTMCEDSEGNYINETEAHYICAVLNAPSVEQFILNSSDTRTFKIDPHIYLPKFDETNSNHLLLADFSEQAHTNPSKINEIRKKIDKTYLILCDDNPDYR